MKILSLACLLIFQFSFCGNATLEFATSSMIANSHQNLDRGKLKVASIVYKSTDGGQRWIDISEGLPEMVKPKDGGTHLDSFFADERGLYLSAGNWMYHNNPHSTSSWSKEILPDDHRMIVPAGKTGILAYNALEKDFLRNTNGSSTWTPTYETFLGSRPQTFLETAGGTIFVGTDRRLFRSTDSGKSWTQVDPLGWVLKLIESEGMLMAATTKGIVRSNDNGQHWEMLNSEEGVGMAIDKDGFAALATVRGIQTSYDGGKTWKSISGLPDNNHISAIFRVGEYLLSTHAKGISRSLDKGKTWTLLLPATDKKVFDLCVSGNVIYAILRTPGC